MNRFLFTFLILSLIHSFANEQEKQQKEKTIVLAAALCPPYSLRQESPQQGYAVELAKKIFGEAGYQVEYKLMPWKRALNCCLNYKIDALISTTPVDKTGLVIPEEEIGKSHQAFLIPRDSKWSYEGVHSLESISLGAIVGYDYGEEINEYITGNKDDIQKIQLISGEEAISQNVKKLISGRIQALLGDKTTLNWVVVENQLSDKVRLIERPAKSEIFYISFCPKSRGNELAKIWDHGMKNLRRQKKLNSILAPYGLKDWRDTRVKDVRKY